MLINTPVSLGELVDKISILIVKQRNITDQKKLNQVNLEWVDTKALSIVQCSRGYPENYEKYQEIWAAN